jgi:hypothetical protein
VESPIDKIVTLKHVQREKTCGVVGNAGESIAKNTRQPLALVAEGAKVDVVKRRGKKEKKPAYEQLPMEPAEIHNAGTDAGTYVSCARARVSACVIACVCCH